MRRFEAMIVESDAEETVVLASPTVGIWRPRVEPDGFVSEGMCLGRLSVLGQSHPLFSPGGISGQVVSVASPGASAVPVDYRQPLITVQRDGSFHRTTGVTPASQIGAAVLPLRTPSAGRIYLRPAPDAEPFVVKDSIVEEGQPVALLEVMKTFHRITYGGAGFPPRARVHAICVEDGADVGPSSVLFHFVPD